MCVCTIIIIAPYLHREDYHQWYARVQHDLYDYPMPDPNRDIKDLISRLLVSTNLLND